MKKLWMNFLILIIFLGAVLITVNVIDARISNKHQKNRIVVTNRITEEIEQSLSHSWMISSLYPYGVVPSELANGVFYERKSEWESIYGKDACPQDVVIHIYSSEDIQVIEPEETTKEYTRSNRKDYNSGGAVISEIYFPSLSLGGSDEEMEREPIGLIEYHFAEESNKIELIILNVSISVIAIIVFLYTLWISVRIIAPFNKLSEYPERLSKGEITEKLPETRNKFFGRYIWGMNMLSDKLESDRETIRKFTVDRQKFVTTMVHGIKTPTASIKLLAEAIATGLYSPDGKVNDKDAELAEKIKKNAVEIETLVSSAMEEGTTAIFDYDPKVEPFYRKKIEEYILEEYGNRLKMNRIPLEINAEGNPLINSDFTGVCRILRQLMDNAIKYGDGTGITLTMKKNEEGHFITVSNNGEPLPESEVSFVFNSLWRGSNSAGVKGHGIGLYESRLIARKLGGDIRMRVNENSTEVTLFLT